MHCFLLDITCTLVPAIKLISIWCTFDRVSILLSILHLSLDNRKNCEAITIEMLKSEISVAMQKVVAMVKMQQLLRTGNEESQDHIV